MNVILTGTSYPKNRADWRGIFIRNMVYAIAECEGVKLSYWGPPGDLPANVAYLCSDADRRWLADLMEHGGIAHMIRQGGIAASLAPLQLLWRLRRAYGRARSADIIHANWLQTSLPIAANSTPLLVTVLGTDFALLRKHFIKRMLRRVFSRRKTIVAPNAEWMLPELGRYFGDVAEVRHIPFGIDPVWYAIDRPRDETVTTNRWLLVARLTRKKIGPLFAWGESLFSKGPHELHVFGPMQEEIPLPSWVHYHGPTTPEDLAKNWFPSSAGLISLSEHDEGRPQVMLEAMAAGLPIIASPLPAHTGLITHRESGWIAATKSGLEEGISWLSDRRNSLTVGASSRAAMRQAVGTWADCAHRYVSAYQDLVGH